MKVTLLLIGTLCVLSVTAEDFDIISTSNPVMEARMVSVEQNLGKLEGIEELLKQLMVAVQGIAKELDTKHDILVDIDGKMDEQKHITKTVEDKFNVIDRKTDELKQITKTVENTVVKVDEKTDELINAASEVKEKNKNDDEKMDELKHSTKKVHEKVEELDIKMDELNNATKTVEGMVKELDTNQNILVDIGTRQVTELYRSGNLRYYKVPVSFGTRMREGTVADACQQFGMMAVCSGPDDGCKFNSGRCTITPLSSDCYGPMQPLSKILCNGKKASECSQLEGMFSCFHEWTDKHRYNKYGECGNVGGSYGVHGEDFVSRADTPLYAYCVLSV